MIKVLVNGACGRMGQQVVAAVQAAEDMELVAKVDLVEAEGVYNDLALALEATTPDVAVDFTHPSVVAGNIATILAHGCNCVVGTTGLSTEKLQEIYDASPGKAALFVAPNFTTGAVLMMEFARIAAKYFPDAEVIEYHHNGKADAPSGTAMSTARIIAGARDNQSKAPGKETEIEGAEGARGALIDGVPVHSVRSEGFVANQQVIFGSVGQTLSIHHVSHDRASYMPGVLLAIREIGKREGLTIGLEKLMLD